MALRRLLPGRVRADMASLISGGRLKLSPTIKNQINNNNHQICNHYRRRQCHYVCVDANLFRDDYSLPKIYIPLKGYEDKGYVVDSARFALNIHNQRENAQLQFVRVLKVAYIPRFGMDLEITLEVNDAGKLASCRTVVHCKPWDGSKRLTSPLVLGV